MNRQKHKLSRRILAVLLMAAMLITMLPSAMFAAPSGDGNSGGTEPTVQTSEPNLEPENTFDNNVTLSKTAERVDEDTWEVTLQVTPKAQDISRVQQEVVLVLDTSSSMRYKLDEDKEPGPWDEADSRFEVLQEVLVGDRENDGLIDTLAEAGAKVAVVAFAYDSQTNLLGDGFYDLSDSGEKEDLESIISSYGVGEGRGTDIKAGLDEALDLLSPGTDKENRSVILLSDGACDVKKSFWGEHTGQIDPDNPKNDFEKEYIQQLNQTANNVKNKASLYSISFANYKDNGGNTTDGYRTLEMITDKGNLYTSSDYSGLKNNFEQIVSKILPMVNDPLGDKVELVPNTLTAKIGGNTAGNVSGANGVVRWNPDKDESLEAGQTLTITYQVKLKADQLTQDGLESLYGTNGSGTNVPLNKNATLNYRVINNHGGSAAQEPLPFPQPEGTVQVAKLSISNVIDEQPAETDSYTDQYALVHQGEFYSDFTWVSPADEDSLGGEGLSYTGSTLTVPGTENAVDVTSDSFAQNLAPVTGGEYKLVHEYSSAQAGTLTLEIYVDGERVTITEDNLTDYLQDLTATGQTEAVDFTYNEGKVTVGYDYEQYDSADLQFAVNEKYVLQAVDGEFIIGKNSWQEVKEENGVTIVDNVAGDSTLKIYLNTPYTVSYLPTEAGVTDDSTYIVSAQEVSAPNFPDDLDSADRSEGCPGGWSDTSLKTEVKLATVPDDYTGWYKTENGSAKHEDTYTGIEIKNAAENNDDNTPTVIECYAQEVKPAITGIEKEVVTEKVEGIEGTYQYPTVDADGNPLLTVNKGDDVTLLYKITVTGDEGAGFKVTDTNAQYVGTTTDGVEIETEDGITGTIPAGGEVVLYVSMTHENVTGETPLKNSATVENTGDGEDLENPTVEEEVPVELEETFTLIYDANGGTIGSTNTAEKTNLNADSYNLWQWTENADGTFTSTGILPDGYTAENTESVPTHADAPAPADTIISDAGESVPVVFIGWTEEPATDDAGKVDQSKIFAAGEELPVTTDNVTINAATDMNGKAVYAVWGYDENRDGIADAEQVIVTPADIKIYTGGNGYSSVVNDVNAEVDNSTTSDGLPTPGYYIILPNDVNEKVLAKAEQDGATVTNSAGKKVADLSDYLTFDYSNGDEKRHWTLDRYDGTSGNTSMAYDKFIYRINPATTSVEGESVPIRLLFTDANGNEKISDDFTVSDDVLYQTFDMTIYAGDLDRGLIEATFTSNTGVSAQNIGVGSGTLTVRGVVTDENTTVNTTPILEAGADVDSATNVSVQLQNANTNFYINESQLEVANPEYVKLLVDDTVSEESDATMQNLAVETFSDTITEDHSVDMKYLDLVDTSNGNTWVTTGGQDVTVFWPYPDDADQSGEFHVVHYTGLDRDEGGALDNNYSTDNMELYSTTVSGEYGITKTDNGILFTVDSFSPFAVYYTAADDEGDDNPPYYPWHPDGDDDGPSGLNTEDHFSYVVGYAEDYRTGEATDDEDLWPVKPNNQITRAEVATIFYRLLEDEVRDEYDTTTNDFSDVTADSWYNQTVSTLARMGIVKGYEDGSFRPNAPITRAEFGAIATRFFAETGATYEPGTFTDVTGDEWFANAIQDAVNLGLIGGYPDGTVRPNNNITRAEACAIVNRTLGRVPDADHLLPEDVMKVWPDNNPTDWFYADMQEATNGHEYAWIEEDGHEIEEWTNLLDKDWTDR